MTSYIIFASVFSRIILKEDIGLVKVLAAILCIGGTMMILRPNLLTDNLQQHAFSLLIMGSGILAAIAIMIKQASVIRELKTSNWMVWDSSFMLIVVLLMIFTSRPVLFEPALSDLLYVLLFTVTAVLARAFHVSSLTFTTGPVAIMAYSSSVVFRLCFQYTVLKVKFLGELRGSH